MEIKVRSDRPTIANGQTLPILFQRMDELDFQLDAIEKAIGQLDDRLQPIRSRNSREAAEVDGVEDERKNPLQNSEVVERIVSMRDRANRLAGSLSCICASLDI